MRSRAPELTIVVLGSRPRLSSSTGVRILLLYERMKLKTWLVIGGAAFGVVGSAAIVAWRMRGRRTKAAGAMFVGAVDEVELGGIARSVSPDASPEFYDPEEIPSEHSEINELRRRMPFG